MMEVWSIVKSVLFGMINYLLNRRNVNSLNVSRLSNEKARSDIKNGLGLIRDDLFAVDDFLGSGIVAKESVAAALDWCDRVCKELSGDDFLKFKEDIDMVLGNGEVIKYLGQHSGRFKSLMQYARKKRT